MIFLSAIPFSIFLFFSVVSEANAIVVVVPVILIPIVKIVALIIGLLATPIVSLTAIFLRIKKNKSIFYGVIVGILILLALSVIITFGLKFINPDRPIY